MIPPAVALPFGGVAGLRFVDATFDRQIDTVARAPAVARAAEAFRDRIAGIATAEALVADRELLEVALGAFGLGDDIANKAFIRKVLAEGTEDREAFANRLSDRRYFEFSRAFGFDRDPPGVRDAGFAGRVAARFLQQRFEEGVGAVDDDLRLALSFRRNFAELAAGAGSADAVWFRILGTPPLRRVFETALALPDTSGIDVDRQLAVFREAALRVFGTSDPAALAESPQIDRIAETFLMRAGLRAAPGSGVRGSVALSLLLASPARSF